MTTSSIQFDFGPLSVEVSFPPALERLAEFLRIWFAAGHIPHEADADLRFELLPHGAPSLEPSATEWDGRAWEAARVQRDERSTPSMWRLRLRDGPLLRTVGRLPDPVFRFLHVHRFDPDGVRASTFLYRHLIPAVQSALLAKNATLVHASSLVGPDRSGMMVSGEGGAGKTSGSAALYLGSPERWRFMSDDLAVLDAQGEVHFSPLPLNVFPYSTRTFPPLHERVVQPMTISDRLQWRIRGFIMGAKGVARRVAPWGTSGVPKTVPLTVFVHLDRSDVTDPVVASGDPESAARTCGRILRHELRTSLSLYAEERRGASQTGAIEALARGGEAVIERALLGVPVVNARIPQAMSVPALGRFLEEVWTSHRPDEVRP